MAKRIVIAFDYAANEDKVLTSFEIGDTFLDDTPLRKELKGLIKKNEPQTTEAQIDKALDELAKMGLTREYTRCVYSTEDIVSLDIKNFMNDVWDMLLCNTKFITPNEFYDKYYNYFDCIDCSKGIIYLTDGADTYKLSLEKTTPIDEIVI